ncbi:MAG: AbrB/MazE/SpoVT family DNA-binding domain-containing protein [Nitrospirae bacterium]|nr:AbrB/MazE/SpoVT family DNA-binding domain-containing protein [Nitrospirota bacterium]MBI5695499.1 AbrB/MazE/SpoVT family DNA-binding domain-containing protein [Nitrospirota bacterium]
MSTLHKIQRSFQITIPADVRKKARLNVGDLVDFEVTEDGILIKPQETIDRSQAWFWSEQWQAEEKKVQEDIKKGRVKRVDNADELFKELNRK